MTKSVLGEKMEWNYSLKKFILHEKNVQLNCKLKKIIKRVPAAHVFAQPFLHFSS